MSKYLCANVSYAKLADVSQHQEFLVAKNHPGIIVKLQIKPKYRRAMHLSSMNSIPFLIVLFIAIFNLFNYNAIIKSKVASL